ncbi:DNA polymerase iota isoform X2 [Chiloscyllium plagiosum]|uniref:DNA polymerase iota isoform X2 n=1 Tax=Chiloscyllium plagiosum TaxID=36176 RepID=UPI001CB81F16|nr:DNA polymerase iota isoform X2 [Chiloscyllium plagiosum]
MEFSEYELADNPRYSLQEEEEEEDEREWCCTVDYVDSSPASPAPVAAASSDLTGNSHKDSIQDTSVPGYRVIVHIDLDCFYAQVEMLRNPEFQGKPLAVHQKHMVVTCNYEARKCGVSKVMSVFEALEICPEMVLICGEDLTHYREISYKITALNIADPRHVRLALGSQIAAEMRTVIFNGVSLTGSAGIAPNKLLAKLVSGIFKPDQQTTLLPESIQDCMESLTHPRQVPGIGPKTAKRLGYLGINSIHGLQTFPLDLLEKDLGVCTAQRIHRLSFGEDDSCVVARGPPQSLSDEDTFRMCSSLDEIRMRIEELLISLLIRLHKDGRVPRTIRLTIRRTTASNKWFNRESRQCPIPNQLMQKINTGPCDTVIPLVEILMKLFQKMVDTRSQFYVSLLSVCFAKLVQPTLASPIKGSIGFYLTQKSPGKSDLSPNGKVRRQLLRQWRGSDDADPGENTAGPLQGMESYQESLWGMSDHVAQVNPNLTGSDSNLPPGIDVDVFKELPANIQKEIIADASSSKGQLKCNSKKEQSTEKELRKGTFLFRSLTEEQRKLLVPPDIDCSPITSSSDTPRLDVPSSLPDDPDPQLEQGAVNDNAASVQDCQPSGKILELGNVECERLTLPNSGPIPSNVDPKVFSELPAELQNELLTDWKQRKTVPKRNTAKLASKVKPNARAKSPKKITKSNSILKYFNKN